MGLQSCESRLVHACYKRFAQSIQLSAPAHPSVASNAHILTNDQLLQAPVPLSIYRSNSKFDENSKHSSVKYTRQITAICRTRHDSDTVVTCAKYRCDRSNVLETRAFWIFIEICLVGRATGSSIQASPGGFQIITHRIYTSQVW